MKAIGYQLDVVMAERTVVKSSRVNSTKKVTAGEATVAELGVAPREGVLHSPLNFRGIDAGNTG